MGLKNLLETLRSYADAELKWGRQYETKAESRRLPYVTEVRNGHDEPVRHRSTPHHELIGHKIAEAVYHTAKSMGEGESDASGRADAALASFRGMTLGTAYANRHGESQDRSALTNAVESAAEGAGKMTGYLEGVHPPGDLHTWNRLSPEEREKHPTYMAAKQREGEFKRDALGRFAGKHESLYHAVAAIAPEVHVFDDGWGTNYPDRRTVMRETAARLLGAANAADEKTAHDIADRAFEKRWGALESKSNN